MLLDPQAQAYLERVAALGLPPITEQTPDEARQRMEEATPGLSGRGPDVQVADSELAGVPVRLFQPHGSRDIPLLVYFHGGGWVLGNVRTHDQPCRALARLANCRVISVEYRLAPEHRFPAAVEDCWAVTEAALKTGRPVAVAGDSAGGNLAAVMALRARNRGLPLRLQGLIYPITDCDLDRPSYHTHATGYGLTRDTMRWFWHQYMGSASWEHPEASPLRASDLTGVAPAWVLVCEYDPLRDEGVAYAEQLKAAGVPVELIEHTGMIHGFFRLGAVIDRTHQAQAQCTAALRRAFA
jgi:acetyl esterase